MKKLTTIITLLLSLSVLLVSLPQLEIIKAQPSSIFIRADGSVEGTSKIQVDGNHYTLTGNITVDTLRVDHGIYVEKDNIIIDGSGYTFEGNGEGTGIQLYQRIGIVIKNFHITNWHTGINNPKSECAVEGNWITECDTGINLADTYNCTFIGNELLGNHWDIVLTACYGNKFIGNNIGKLTWSTAFLVAGENYFDSNYWGEYEGVDDDEDAFGDTPFTVYWIDFGDTNITCYDNNPLIEPIAIPEFLSSTELASIAKPSVPEFTVKLVKGNIEVKIKNQPFVSYYDTSVNWTIDFYYNIRIKGNFSEDWIELYLIEEVPMSSYSEYTVLSYSPVGENSYILGNRMIEFSAGSQIDFQVEAMIGYVQRVFNPNATSQLEMYPYVFTGETSGWSDTRTITIPEQEPQQTEHIEIILAVTLIIVIGTGLLVYFKKYHRGRSQ